MELACIRIVMKTATMRINADIVFKCTVLVLSL